MGEVGNNNNGAKITFYTHKQSPYAQAVQVALLEMGLQFEAVEIDIFTPREEWFLKINPRGLVPALTFEHPSIGTKNIIESDLIVHFLLDNYPHLSHKIWLAPKTIEAAYYRYQMKLFIDVYNSKLTPEYYQIVFASGTDQIEEKIDGLVATIKEHIEPLLEDANPFFGGNNGLTLAEVKTGPTVLRLIELSTDRRLFPESLLEKLNTLPNFSKWAKAVSSRASLQYGWDKNEQAQKMLDILPAMKEKYSASMH